MTAIIDELRQLDAARARGDLTDTELRAAKSKLLETVEDANLLAVTPAAPRAPQPARDASNGLWSLLFLALCGAGVLTLVLNAILGSFSLALTLVVSLAAALLVAAVRQTEA